MIINPLVVKDIFFVVKYLNRLAGFYVILSFKVSGIRRAASGSFFRSAAGLFLYRTHFPV